MEQQQGQSSLTLPFLISWQRQAYIVTLHNEYHGDKGHAGTQGLLQSVCTSCLCPTPDPAQSRDSPTPLPEQAQTQSSLSCNESKPASPLLITLAAAQHRRRDTSLSRSSCSGPFSCPGRAQQQRQEPQGSLQRTGAVGCQQQATAPGALQPQLCPRPRSTGERILLAGLARAVAASWPAQAAGGSRRGVQCGWASAGGRAGSVSRTAPSPRPERGGGTSSVSLSHPLPCSSLMRQS